MLSTLSPEQITMAIATGSTDMLDMIPGIGKKVAHRIVLELKEKIGAGWIAAPATQIAQENTDVLAALTSLGYSAAEAVKAVAALPADQDLNLEEKIKLALQYFGSK
jgi:Holliday junction DNA helicase RuvA